MGDLATVIVGLAAIFVVAAAAAAVSVRARRCATFSPAMHALRDDIARDPVAGPVRAGCGSMEISVWLDDDDRLQVGSEGRYTDGGNALGPLVLRQLALRAEAQGGRVHPGQTGSFLLLITLRESDPDRQAQAYQVLDAALRAYPRLFTRLSEDGVALGPVTVVLTGETVPQRIVAAHPDRLVFCDGSFADIGAWGPPVALVPTVSEHWCWRFAWDGTGEIPAEQRMLLRQLVATAHADGRQVRVYGIPEQRAHIREAFWRELLTAGVDVISTEQPRHLADFLAKRAPTRAEPPRSRAVWTPRRREPADDVIDAERRHGALSAR